MKDDEYYSRYLAGDKEAMDFLLAACRLRLIAYINAIVHNDDDAEDLAMEAFARLIVKRPRIREGGFRAYLYRVARNLALRFISRRSILDFCPENGEFSDSTQPEERLLNEERLRILNKCMNRMEPSVREALWLIYIEELSYEQAAGVMKLSRRRIEYLLVKGRSLMRGELEKEGITDSAY